MTRRTAGTRGQAERIGRRLVAHVGLGAAAVLVLATPVTAQLGGSSPATAVGEVLEQVLIKVNGDIVTQTQFERRQLDAIRARGAQPRTDAELLTLLEEVTPPVVGQVVDELLLLQRGRELGYALTDQALDGIIAELKEENDITTDEQFAEALAAEGMTLESLREIMERQMLIGQVQQVEVLSRVTLTEVEAREYYDANPDEFTEPATVTMREILVRTASGVGAALGPAATEAAQEAAESARQRVLAGEDFEGVVAEVSDAASKANGGLIGPLDITVISENLTEVLAALDVGDISDVIRTPAGYQVIKLEARTEPTPAAFEDVRDTIADSIFNARRAAEYARYIADLREEADIEWKSEPLREAYDEFAAARDQLLRESGALDVDEQ